MGKKGRRGRAKKGQARSASAAPVSLLLDESPATLPSAAVPTPAPLALSEAPSLALAAAASETPPVGADAPPCPQRREEERAESSSPVEPRQSSPGVQPPTPGPPAAPAEASGASAEPPLAPAAHDSEREPSAPEESVPPAGDLDARFFAESSSEAWLAHELELRDPRSVRKMTANVAQRRAHLARYVVGVVGVAVALCLAALIKSAVPAGDDESRARPAAPMAMPAARPSPVPISTGASTEPVATPDESDGGG